MMAFSSDMVSYPAFVVTIKQLVRLNCGFLPKASTSITLKMQDLCTAIVALKLVRQRRSTNINILVAAHALRSCSASSRSEI